MYKPSNRRSPRMVRRPKGDAAAAYAAHALRRLNGISRHFAGYDVADANATADIQAMCQFNDLRNITLQAYIRDTALAEWVVRVYDDHYTLQEPVPTPSEFVLRIHQVPGGRQPHRGERSSMLTSSRRYGVILEHTPTISTPVPS